MVYAATISAARDFPLGIKVRIKNCNEFVATCHAPSALVVTGGLNVDLKWD